MRRRLERFVGMPLAGDGSDPADHTAGALRPAGGVAAALGDLGAGHVPGGPCQPAAGTASPAAHTAWLRFTAKREVVPASTPQQRRPTWRRGSPNRRAGDRPAQPARQRPERPGAQDVGGSSAGRDHRPPNRAAWPQRAALASAHVARCVRPHRCPCLVVGDALLEPPRRPRCRSCRDQPSGAAQPTPPRDGRGPAPPTPAAHQPTHRRFDRGDGVPVVETAAQLGERPRRGRGRHRPQPARRPDRRWRGLQVDHEVPAGQHHLRRREQQLPSGETRPGRPDRADRPVDRRAPRPGPGRSPPPTRPPPRAVTVGSASPDTTPERSSLHSSPDRCLSFKSQRCFSNPDSLATKGPRRGWPSQPRHQLTDPGLSGGSSSVDGPSMDAYDAVVIGGGHNGLACAAYLADAGRSVLVLERRAALGGAARSERVFPGYAAESRRTPTSSASCPSCRRRAGTRCDAAASAASRRTRRPTTAGSSSTPPTPTAPGGRSVTTPTPGTSCTRLTASIAERMFPTMTEPLLGREAFRRRVADDDGVARPLRATDRRAARAPVRRRHRPRHRVDRHADRHVHARPRAARQPLLPLSRHRTSAPATGTFPSAGWARCRRSSRGRRRQARRRAGDRRRRDGVADRRRAGDGHDRRRPHDRRPPGFANVAPVRAGAAAGRAGAGPRPEGAQVKINMLLSRLPRLRDRGCVRSRRSPARSTSTRATGSSRRLPPGRRRRGARPRAVRDLLPLADRPDDPRPRAAGRRRADADAVRLHMPARLFRVDPGGRAGGGDGVDPALARQRARRADRRVPRSTRLHRRDGTRWRSRPTWGCRAATSSTATCSGRSPSGPSDEGRWGVETAHANVFVCGAGARRGGGVSAIPGRNAAMAALGRF